MSKFIAAIELCDNLIVGLNFEKIKQKEENPASKGAGI